MKVGANNASGKLSIFQRKFTLIGTVHNKIFLFFLCYLFKVALKTTLFLTNTLCFSECDRFLN
jgi:hypothetical protein